jgi:PAS domain S-box-containing protein
MEEELRASEEKYRNIFSSIMDVYGEVALDGTILEASPSIKEVGGYSREEIIGTSLLDYHVNPESRAEAIEELLEKGRVKDWEFQLRRKDGNIITLSFNTELVRDDDGVPIKTRGVMRDITERKRMEEDLRKYSETLEGRVLERTAELQKAVDQLTQEIVERKKAEEKFRALIDVTSDTVFELDNDLAYTYMSPRSTELTGYAPEDHIGRTPFDFAPPDEAERLRAIAQDAIESRQPLQNIETIILCKDGRLITLETSASPIIDNEGTFSGYIGIGRDITEKKRLEEELRLSEKMYRSMFEEAPDIFFILDLETMIIKEANRYALERLEYGEEMLGKIDITQIVHPDDYERATKRLSDMVINKDRMPNFPLRIVTRTGKVRHIEQSGVVIWDDEGNAKSFMGLARDVTERKQAEEARRLSEERYRRILDSCHDMIAVIDENAQMLYANRSLHENTGYVAGEEFSTGLNFENVYHEDREYVAEKFFGILSGQPAWNVQYRGIHSSGEIRWVEANADLIQWAEGQKAIVNVMRDITERKNAEEEIRLSKERYERILNTSHDMVVVVDENLELLFANRSAFENTGYTPEDVERMADYETIHPDDRERIAQTFLSVLNGEPAHGVQFRAIDKNGETRWAESNADMTYWDEGQRAVINMLRDITERKKADEALENSVSLLNATLESTADGILVTDLKGNITNFNKQLLQMWRIPEHIAASGDEKRVLSYVRKQLADSEEFVGKTMSRRQPASDAAFEILKFKDGKIFEQHSRPQKLGNDIVGQVLSFRDITSRVQIEEALQRSEEKYRSMFEQAADSILLVDANTGTILDFNERAHENLGYSRKEFQKLGIPGIEVLESPDEYEKHVERIARNGVDIFETKHRTKSGEIRDMQVNCKMVTTGERPILQSICRDITDQKRAEEALKKSQEQLRERSVHLETLREEERTKIAREIHDELGQALTALKMDVFWLAKRLPKSQKAILEKTETMTGLIDTTIQSVKKISTELRPGLLDDLGLASALEWQAEEFQKHTEIKCKVAISPKDLSLGKEPSTAVFRIFQEALTNVGRHAKATKITVKLEKVGGQLRLTVKDNGKGIAENEISKPGTFGLVGIRERVAALGGEMKINGANGKGPSMTVTIPIGG